MNDRRSAVSTSRAMSSAPCSQRLYFIAVAHDVAAATEQALRASGAGQRHLRVADEQFEEALFLGHESTKPSKPECLLTMEKPVL
jgi:hypothetical protein